MTTNTTSGAADLRTAAQAVVDRWDTPLWKDVPATAEYIGRLRAALAAGQATAAQAAPATQQAREVSDAMVLAALQMQHPAAYGQYLRHPANGPKTSIRTEAEIDTARRMIAAALAAAPQPSPTAQAAESVPAIQGEMNVQLDIDSNHSAPGQQRDVARSVALGQPVGNGSDQVAGHPSAQGDKLLTVADRNIRSFLRSATFKSESDREAALNCVDVLWAAARDPADSVQEDAALWHWLAEYLVGTRTDLDDEIVACETVNDLRKLVESAIKQGEKQ